MICHGSRSNSVGKHLSTGAEKPRFYSPMPSAHFVNGHMLCPKGAHYALKGHAENALRERER